MWTPCVCLCVYKEQCDTIRGSGVVGRLGGAKLRSIVSASPQWKVGLWLRPTLSVFRESDCLPALLSSLSSPSVSAAQCPPTPSPLPTLAPPHSSPSPLPHQVGLVAFRLLRVCHIENISSFPSSFSSSSRLTTRGPSVLFSSQPPHTLPPPPFSLYIKSPPHPTICPLCTTAAL